MIESAQNSSLKLYRSLGKKKNRAEYRLLPLEGVRLVADAIKRDAVLETVILREGLTAADYPFLRIIEKQARIITVAEKLFDQTAFTESAQGILAIARKPERSLADLFSSPEPLLLIVDGVQDPGNLGTMLRSAAGAGAAGAVFLPGTVDASNPKALRAAMGAYFAIPCLDLGYEQLAIELEKHRIPLVITAASAAGAYDQRDWSKKAAVVIGSEGDGVSDFIMGAAAESVSIPLLPRVESLNAAIAMSVIFFEAARQRRRI